MSRGPVRRLFRIFERPPSARDAIELEIRHHIEECAEALASSEGLSRGEALAEARRRFGDVDGLAREMESGERSHRRSREWGTAIRQTLADGRFALRGLRKSPGLAAIVTLTLALGIGLNVAIFSVVKGVLLDPLPYPDADRLVWGVGAFSGSPAAAVSPPDYLDYREQASSFEYLGARRGIASVALTGSDRPEILRGETVTAEFFEALGGVPVLGRGLDRADEEGASRIVVLSHSFWERHFGGRADALGAVLTLDGEPHEVVGVMPAGFQLFSEPDFWVPIPLHTGGNLIRRFHNLRLVGKRAPGVSLDEAQAELDVIAARLARQYPESNETWRLPIVPLSQVFVGNVRTSLLVMWAAVGFVLLIVCANVANLLLARGSGRQAELALRRALGASRRRILRLLLIETTTLAGAGCAAGIGVAFLAVRLLSAVGAASIPRVDEVALDGWVLAFAIAASAIAGLVFGLLPAIVSSRVDLTRDLKSGGRGSAASSGRIRGALVVAEVALSFVLLMGAGLLLQSVARLLAVDPGFEPAGAIIASISLPEARYGDGDARLDFYRRLRDRLEAMPGVEGVGIGSELPLTGRGNDTYVGVPGRLELGSDQQFNSQVRTVSGEFFDVMQVPMLRGRGFDGSDREGGAPVVVIDEPFADAIFPGEDPVGQRIAIDLGEPYVAEIVGVVGPVHSFSLATTPGLHMYLPYDQHPTRGGMSVVVRTSTDPSALIDRIPAVVAEIDPLQPVSELEAYRDVVDRGLTQPRLRAWLLAVFAIVALTLAVIGVYGVLSYLVARRAREVGVRIALGAGRLDVVRLIVGHGARLTVAGLLIGIAASAAVTRYMSSLLYGVGATDPVTLAAVAALLGLTALAASYLPARRAARVDPTVTLRQD